VTIDTGQTIMMMTTKMRLIPIIKLDDWLQSVVVRHLRDCMLVFRPACIQAYRLCDN